MAAATAERIPFDDVADLALMIDALQEHHPALLRLATHYFTVKAFEARKKRIGHICARIYGEEKGDKIANKIINAQTLDFTQQGLEAELPLWERLREPPKWKKIYIAGLLRTISAFVVDRYEVKAVSEDELLKDELIGVAKTDSFSSRIYTIFFKTWQAATRFTERASIKNNYNSPNDVEFSCVDKTVTKLIEYYNGKIPQACKALLLSPRTPIDASYLARVRQAAQNIRDNRLTNALNTWCPSGEAISDNEATNIPPSNDGTSELPIYRPESATPTPTPPNVRPDRSR